MVDTGTTGVRGEGDFEVLGGFGVLGVGIWGIGWSGGEQKSKKIITYGPRHYCKLVRMLLAWCGNGSQTLEDHFAHYQTLPTVI